MDRYLDVLISLSLFSGFTKHELTQVFHTSKFEIKEYGKEQIIHLQNEKCHAMDIILNGKVMVQNIDENGNVLTINVFASGEIIGANLLFSRRNIYPMTVIAVSKTKILHMQSEMILDLCRVNKTFMLGLLTAISDKTVILTEKINTIYRKTIRQCIMDYLKYEHSVQRSKVIKLNLSKKDLAERLGIQRSSLSRELNKMRRDGLLEYDAWTITLKNIYR